jgi:hypothetical protein
MPLQDDIYLACADVANPNGLNTGAGATGVGPVGHVFIYDIVPLTLEVNNVAASQSPATAALTLSAGTGTTAVTVNGVACIQLDVPRALKITSGGNDSGITFDVVGYDVYGVAMTEYITGANATAATGAKAWFSIASITPSASVASTVEVGTADKFGLPYFLSNLVYCLGVQWNSTLAKDTGTLAVGVTTTPSHTTGDVRGTYVPSSGASDGTKRLVIAQVISSAQVGSGATAVSIFGKTQA